MSSILLEAGRQTEATKASGKCKQRWKNQFPSQIKPVTGPGATPTGGSCAVPAEILTGGRAEPAIAPACSWKTCWTVAPRRLPKKRKPAPWPSCWRARGGRSKPRTWPGGRPQSPWSSGRQQGPGQGSWCSCRRETQRTAGLPPEANGRDGRLSCTRFAMLAVLGPDCASISAPAFSLVH